MKKLIVVVIIAVVVVGYLSWQKSQADKLMNAQFVSGNGRIEATEISVATRVAGRLEEVTVKEGAMVQKDDVLAQMDVKPLMAQLHQHEAKLAEAEGDLQAAKANVEVCNANIASAKSTAEQFRNVMEGKKKTFERSQTLFEKKAETAQKRDDDEAAYLASKASYEAAQANVLQAEANLQVAHAKVANAEAKIAVAKADIESTQVDINDCSLKAPRRGRIQYRISEAGEVLSAGGRVLNLVDLTDVYISFFLPEYAAGKVEIGSEVRIVLDALPEYPIPANVTFVASVAQFTPKTVETREERQKLMFRVKASIPVELLEEYIDMVKTGLPGMAYVKMDPMAEWPAELRTASEKGLTK